MGNKFKENLIVWPFQKKIISADGYKTITILPFGKLELFNNIFVSDNLSRWPLGKIQTSGFRLRVGQIRAATKS